MSVADSYPERQRRKGYSAFVPLVLFAMALMIMVGFQSANLASERHALNSSRTNQDEAVSEARNVRQQLDSIAKGMSQLAAQGNDNAARLLLELKKLGVSVKSP